MAGGSRSDSLFILDLVVTHEIVKQCGSFSKQPRQRELKFSSLFETFFYWHETTTQFEPLAFSLLGEFVRGRVRGCSNCVQRVCLLPFLILLESEARELEAARAMFDKHLLPSLSSFSDGSKNIELTVLHFNSLIDGYKQGAESYRG
jgi:hypothetical protein